MNATLASAVGPENRSWRSPLKMRRLPAGAETPPHKTPPPVDLANYLG
jgi:hypothetical protein